MAEFQEYAGSAQRGNTDEQEDETRQNTITYFSRFTVVGIESFVN